MQTTRATAVLASLDHHGPGRSGQREPERPGEALGAEDQRVHLTGWNGEAHLADSLITLLDEPGLGQGVGHAPAAGFGGIPLVVAVGHEEGDRPRAAERSEEHTSELQSLMRISYAVF